MLSKNGLCDIVGLGGAAVVARLWQPVEVRQIEIQAFAVISNGNCIFDETFLLCENFHRCGISQI